MKSRLLGRFKIVGFLVFGYSNKMRRNLTVGIFLLFSLVLVRVESGRRSVPRISPNCTVNYNGQTYGEGEVFGSLMKRHKIEHCQVQRAFQACGSALWYMVNLVCSRLERYSPLSGRQRRRRYSSEMLLTDSCCSQFCTLHEISRYCPILK